MQSVLSGLKVLELAAVGPVPFAGMILSDMGAEITRIDRMPTSSTESSAYSGVENRGRKSIALDLKKPEAVELLLKLIERADVLIEGFRPGVMERLGVGPEVCRARNERLIYGRMTGWGQTGPLANAAGHDINYIALTGALHAMGCDDRPPEPPLNLVGDYGGGGMMLLIGVLAALYERQRSGRGQVIDAAMTDGVAVLMAPIYSLLAQGLWKDKRASNQLDGAAHYYGAYECADGKFVTIGPIEARFYRLLIERCGVDAAQWPEQLDSEAWPILKARLAQTFKTRTRAEWADLLEGTDVCFAPVLSMSEAPRHDHNRARGTFIEIDGAPHPAPAPRFGRTPSRVAERIAVEGEDTASVLADAGFSDGDIRRLIEKKVVYERR